jgi:hypothetical protein
LYTWAALLKIGPLRHDLLEALCSQSVRGEVVEVGGLGLVVLAVVVLNRLAGMRQREGLLGGQLGQWSPCPPSVPEKHTRGQGWGTAAPRRFRTSVAIVAGVDEAELGGADLVARSHRVPVCLLDACLASSCRW